MPMGGGSGWIVDWLSAAIQWHHGTIVAENGISRPACANYYSACNAARHCICTSYCARLIVLEALKILKFKYWTPCVNVPNALSSQC